MIATVTFIDNRTGASTTKITPPAVVGESSPFYPEIGETAPLGFQKAMQKMAKDIVWMMEAALGRRIPRGHRRASPTTADTAPIDAADERTGDAAQVGRAIRADDPASIRSTSRLGAAR